MMEPVFLSNNVTREHQWPLASPNVRQEEDFIYGQSATLSTIAYDYACSNGCSSVYINTDPHHVITNITGTLQEQGVAVNERSDSRIDEQCLNMDTISYYLQPLQDSLNVVDGKQQPNTDADELFQPHSITETENGPSQQYELAFTNEGILDNFVLANSNSRQMQESDVHTGCKGIEKSLTCPSFQIEQQRNPIADSCIEKQMKETLFECTFCKETFKHKDIFLLHLTTHAVIEKYFGCLYCEQNFHQKCDLVVHLGTHTETQKYKHSIATTQSNPTITCAIQSEDSRCKKTKFINSMGHVYSMISKRRPETEWQRTVRCNASVQQRGSMFLPGPAQHSHNIRRLRHISISNEKQDNTPTEMADCTSMSRDTYSNDVTNITEILLQPQPGITFESERALNCRILPSIRETESELPQQYDLALTNEDKSSTRPIPYFEIEQQRGSPVDSHLGKQMKEKRFECTWCKETFKHKEAFLLHLTTHAIIKQYFECLYCEQNFHHKCDLVFHLGTHAESHKYKHSIATTRLKMLPLSLDGGNTSICPPEYQGYTKKPCATSNNFDNIGPDCILCSKLFSNVKEYDEHLRTHCDAKGAVCPVCNKTISSRANLKVHLHIHSGYRPYHCSYCHKTFQNHPNLAKHERIHKGEKPYTCKYCKKSFTKQDHLTIHERIHTGEKPYTCKYCKKSFTERGHLKAHERLHTGEKPYTCKYCKKSFTQQNVLRQHERIHTGEKPYTCKYCKKSFTQRNSLKNHEQIH